CPRGEWKIVSSSTTSPSTPPGTAQISLTRRIPDGSRRRWTTTSRLTATVGTTNAEEMFDPASRGRVEIFVIAARAEFAWMVPIPGSPKILVALVGDTGPVPKPPTGKTGHTPVPHTA